MTVQANIYDSTNCASNKDGQSMLGTNPNYKLIVSLKWNNLCKEELKHKPTDLSVHSNLQID